MDDNLALDKYPQFTTDLLIYLIPRVFKLWDTVHDLAVDYFQQP